MSVYSRRPRVRIVPGFIFINIAIYILWFFHGSRDPWMQDHFLVSWSAIEENRPWVLITSVFSHNMFLHLVINMIVLRDFGSALESILGARRFLVLYFFAGITGSLLHSIVSNYFLLRPDLPALGASGAISGLILVFSLKFPRIKMLLFGLIPVPALLGAVAFVGLDLWGLSAQIHGGGLPIGHGAHLGGALAGALYHFLHADRSEEG